MPSDGLLTTTAPGVKTSTFSTTPVVLGKARILNPLFMRVIYSAAANASGANSWTFISELSLDGASTWFTMSGAQPIVLSPAQQSGELYLELDLNSPTINPFMSNAPQVRCTGTLSGAGSGATITVSSVEVVPAWS